jgi:hypothetical protein
MSRSIGSFKNMKQQQIPITQKVSQNKLKKLNKTNNKNEKVDIGITDEDFEKMMEENNYSNNTTNSVKYIIPNKDNLSESVKNILNVNLLGSELESFVKTSKESSKLYGPEYLTGLLETIKETDLTWISLDKYGILLKYLLEDNSDSQFISLLVIQDYVKKFGFTKITYKNTQIYQIKILFQLLFTNEIIDEPAYWKWQEYLAETNDLDEKTKNILVIQTNDFFQILNIVFEDEETNGENEENDQMKFGKELNKPIKSKSDESDESDKSDENFNVPVEQDYNLEENDFNLDDL